MKTWNNPTKISWRQEAIIAPYRQVTGLQAIPKDQQYWTLSSDCVTNNEVYEGSEPHQMVSSGLIQPNQFYGIDHDENVVKRNQTCKSGFNFLHGDIYSVLAKCDYDGQFNPAIINLDFFGTPKSQIEILVDVIHLLTYCRYRCFVVANFSLQARHIVYSREDIVNELNKNQRFLLDFGDGWSWYRQEIAGYISSKFPMGTIILYR